MNQPLITYLGGKQNIASSIISQFGEHRIYCEVFCGGAAVLFAKPKLLPPKKEVINDRDRVIATLYQVARDNPEELRRKIELTPYSEADFLKAKEIRKNWRNWSEIEVAWATIVCCNQSFGGDLNGGWAFSRAPRSSNESTGWGNYQQNLERILERLRGVYVSCQDAIACIDRWDTPETLFYCDPPYPETYQTYAHTYTVYNFQSLINRLDKIQGKFFLSGYPSGERFIPKGWERVELSTRCYASKRGREERREILWTKKKENRVQLSLFG